MSGYPGLIGRRVSGQIADGCERAGEQVTGEVVGGSGCHPIGHLALVVDGASGRELVYISAMNVRMEAREVPALPSPHTRLPPAPRSHPSDGTPE